MSNFNHVKYGRFLSYLLRHNPNSLIMTKDGFVDVKELLDYSNSKGKFITRDLLSEVVKLDDKQRFSFNNDLTMIRANQGHSISVDVGLKEVNPDVYLFHGTSPSNIDSILANGISKMKRNHVHLSKDLFTSINVGSRHCSRLEKPVVFIVDVFSMIKDGYKFYLSENNVWLTDSVPSKYIKVVNKHIIRRYPNITNISDKTKNDFLTELFELYRKYGVSISHEDSNGGFILNNYSEEDVSWMKDLFISSDCIDFDF